MKRLATWVVLALVGGLCVNIAGAGPAWAGNGETATSLNVPSSAHYGQLVTASGQVKDDSDSCINLITADCDLPAGSVSVFDGAAPTPFGTDSSLDNANPGLLGALGSCCVEYSVDYSGLTPGLHYIVARYSSTNDFDSSDSDTNQHINDRGPHPITINAEPTSTTMSQDFATTTTGGNVRFTVQVTPIDPPDLFHGASPPTGSVDVREVVGATTTTFGAASIDLSGRAVITTGTIPAGTHTLWAHYNGDTNYLSSDSATLTHTVSPGATSSSLGTSASSTVFGQPVTLTDTVSAVAPASGTPTGTVTFDDLTAGGSAGSKVLDGSGVAALTTSALAPGSHTIRAGYPGDANFLAGNSNTVSVSVSRANTTTALTSSAHPSTLGQSVTFTATVAPVAPATGAPDGTVQFKDGTTDLGAPKAVSGGVARLSTTTLGGGSHSITAAYSGSNNYNPSTSGTVAQTVTCTNTVATNASGNLTVSSTGSTCITGVSVAGSLTVPAGAKVSIYNATIGGSLIANGASSVTLCGSTVRSAVDISNTTGFVLIGDPFEDGCAGNALRSSVTLTNNQGGVEIGDNKVLGNTTVKGTTGTGPYPGDSGTELERNAFSGALACSGNTPPPVNDTRPNSVAGTRSGQCAAPFA